MVKKDLRQQNMNTLIVKKKIYIHIYTHNKDILSLLLELCRFDEEDLPGTSRFPLQRAHILPRMSWAVQWVGTRDLIWSRRFCYRVEGLGFVYIRSCAARLFLSLSLSLSLSLLLQVPPLRLLFSQHWRNV